MALATPFLRTMEIESRTREPDIPGAIAGGVDIMRGLQQMESQRQMMGLREQKEQRQQEQHEAALAANRRKKMVSEYIAEVFRSSTDEKGQFQPDIAADQLYQAGFPEAIETANELTGVQQRQRGLELEESRLQFNINKFNTEQQAEMAEHPIFSQLKSGDAQLRWIASLGDAKTAEKQGFAVNQEMIDSAQSYVKHKDQIKPRMVSIPSVTNNEFELADRQVKALEAQGLDLKTELSGDDYENYRDFLLTKAKAEQKARGVEGTAQGLSEIILELHNQYKDKIIQPVEKSWWQLWGAGQNELTLDYNKLVKEEEQVINQSGTGDTQEDGALDAARALFYGDKV